ncbi:MAG: hypothetical protein ACOX3W_02985 [Christensenellaceae bacterium]|jgi:hypothetical protein
MVLLKGEARKLLLELIKNKNSDLAGLLAAKFEGLDVSQDTRLRATIKHLIDNGYLNIPSNGWADNVPYFATLTYEGKTILKLKKRKHKKKCPDKGTLTIFKTLMLKAEI